MIGPRQGTFVLVPTRLVLQNHHHELRFAQFLGALKRLLGILLGRWLHLLFVFCHRFSSVGTAELIRFRSLALMNSTLGANLKSLPDCGSCPMVSTGCGVEWRLL